MDNKYDVLIAYPKAAFTVRQHSPGVTVISVAGEVDVANAAELDAHLAWAGRRPGVHLVLDLGGLRFLDSCGLRVLLGADAIAAGRGGGLHLAAACGEPARLMQITEAASVLSVHETVQQALAAIAPEDFMPSVVESVY